MPVGLTTITGSATAVELWAPAGATPLPVANDATKADATSRVLLETLITALLRLRAQRRAHRVNQARCEGDVKRKKRRIDALRSQSEVVGGT
jgi:hypothetical protein